MVNNKKGGVVGDLVTGTGGIIILTIIVLVIVSTLLGASLLAKSTAGIATTNETTGGLNSTGYTLANANSSNSGYTITAVWVNVSPGTPYLIPAANYTVSTAGVLTNNTVIPDADEYNNATVSYTYTFTFDSNYEQVSDRMSTNFTQGIDNVSGKIPTILLIAAVVLLFGVIVLLIRQSGAMGIGTGGASL